MSFEYLRDKSANLCFAGLAIHTGRVRYVPSNDKILDVLGLVRREFRRKSGVPVIIGSFDVSSLTDLEKFTILVIPDVSGMNGQRPTVSFQKP